MQVAAAVATLKADRKLPQGEKLTWNDLAPIANAWAQYFRRGLDELCGVSKY